MSEKSLWNAILICPNLVIKPSEGFAASRFALCSIDDMLVRDALVDSLGNANTLALARSYRTVWSKEFSPSLLLSRADRVPDGRALRTFRDICAVATCLYAGSLAVTGGQWHATSSDLFTFSRFTGGRTGLTSLDGLSRGWWDSSDLRWFRGTACEVVDTPAHYRVAYDRTLYRKLLLVFERQRSMPASKRRQIFRSLSLAFHALRYPSDGLGTLYDFGVAAGLWVSAFETLVNPYSRDVQADDVRRVLDGIDFVGYELRRRSFVVRNRAGTPKGKTTCAGALYGALYSARNLFTHGSLVTVRALRWRGWPILELAPTLYALLLHEHLRSTGDVDEIGRYLGDRYTHESALVTSMQPPEEGRRRRRSLRSRTRTKGT